MYWIKIELSYRAKFPSLCVVTARNPFLSDSNRKSRFQIVQNPPRSAHPSSIDDIGQLLSHAFFVPQADGAISTPPPVAVEASFLANLIFIPND